MTLTEEIQLTADLAEYAAMYGIPFYAAVGIYALSGHAHIIKHITR